MAKLSFSFETGELPVSELIEALATRFGYSPYILDLSGNYIPNPQTKASFCRDYLRRFIIQSVREFRESQVLAEIQDIHLE